MSNGMTRREFEITDINVIKEILDKAKIAHIGLVDGNEPYVVPMNYGYTFEDGKLIIYLHGARRGRKLDVMQANPNVFFDAICDIKPFSGDVACKYGISYACVMGKGKAQILNDVEEKKKGLVALMKTQTGKDFTFDDKTASVVSVIKISVSEFSAKSRPMPKREQTE